MKKLILIAFLAVGLLTANAATVVVGVPSASGVNVAFLLGTNTPATITAVTLVSTNNNVSNIQFYDSYWNTLKITNSSYTSVQSYGTNYLYNWTNYYGVSNGVYITNALIEVTNTVAAATNSLSPVFLAFAGTNSTTAYNNLQVKIGQGLWVTNTIAASLGTLTITYTQ